MLTGRQIDSRFLDRWERDVCASLQRNTGRPYMLVRDDSPTDGSQRQSWLIDPILAFVCTHQPVSSGYFMRFEPEGTSSRLWVGVGVTGEPALGGFLRESLQQPEYIASIKPLFRKLGATAFMGQGSWIRSTMTSRDGSLVVLTTSLLDQAAAIYAPSLPAAEFLVAEVHRVYDTADDMEPDVERVAGRLTGDFGVLYNGLFPRTVVR
ncbi:MAG: hypothetical protein ACYDHF_08185 [Candidatus Cryosericum sp.]